MPITEDGKSSFEECKEACAPLLDCLGWPLKMIGAFKNWKVIPVGRTSKQMCCINPDPRKGRRDEATKHIKMNLVITTVLFWYNIYTDVDYIRATPMAKDWLRDSILLLLILPWFFSITSWIMQFLREDDPEDFWSKPGSHICEIVTGLTGCGEIRSVLKEDDEEE